MVRQPITHCRDRALVHHRRRVRLVQHAYFVKQQHADARAFAVVLDRGTERFQQREHVLELHAARDRALEQQLERSSMLAFHRLIVSLFDTMAKCWPPPCKEPGDVLDLNVFQSNSAMIQSLEKRHPLETYISVALPPHGRAATRQFNSRCTPSYGKCSLPSGVLSIRPINASRCASAWTARTSRPTRRSGLRRPAPALPGEASASAAALGRCLSGRPGCGDDGPCWRSRHRRAGLACAGTDRPEAANRF